MGVNHPTVRTTGFPEMYYGYVWSVRLYGGGHHTRPFLPQSTQGDGLRVKRMVLVASLGGPIRTDGGVSQTTQ